MTVNVKMDSTTHTLLEDSDIYNILYPIGSVRIISSTLTTKDKDPILSRDGTTWELAKLAIKCANNTKFALDLYNGVFQNDQNVQIYTWSNGFPQKWYPWMVKDAGTGTDKSLGGMDIYVRVA